MNDPLLEQGAGHTLLHPDDRRGLKPTWIRTRGDLNAAEQANIAKALASLRQPTVTQILDDLWLRRLHERMFGDVWRWAGSYRTATTNLGVDFQHIAPAVRNLVGNAAFWTQAGQDPVTIGARFHHELVSIHPFPNGNGRHGRAAAGLLVTALGGAPLTWGRGYGDVDQARRSYISALQAADDGDLRPLVTFVTA